MTSAQNTPRSWGQAAFGAALLMGLGFAPAAGAVPRQTLSAGFVHTCGIQSNGMLACWGSDTYHQSTVPSLWGTHTQVSAGSYHTCAVGFDGSINCWGAGSDGDASYYNYGQGIPPVDIFIQVSAGGYHTCAVKSDGTVACWGRNNYGQAPSAVAGTFTQVSAGGSHTCGVKSDGTVACWGNKPGARTTPPAGTFRQVSAGDLTPGGPNRGQARLLGD